MPASTRRGGKNSDKRSGRHLDRHSGRNAVKVAIAGAGAVGGSIARELAAAGHRVLLMDRRADVINRPDLSPADPAPGTPPIERVTGDVCELSLLESTALQDYDVAIAATGDDKVNLVFSLLAKTEFGVGRAVARVNDPRNEWLFDESWGVDVAVSTPRLLAALVEEAVSVGDLVRLITFRHGGADLVEITLPENAAIAGKAVRRLRLPRDTALVAILRGDRVIVPQQDDPLEGGDELLFVMTGDGQDQLREALGLG